ncbi:MAG: HAD-IA family hydrolase [Oligoflexia bacterium]|nr:HAD-IA family hydrolase [Oligoflexia bacterium]
MQGIKTIIFDLDGTIADSFQVGLDCANALAEKYRYERIEDSPVIRDLSFKEFLVSHLNLGKIRLVLWAREIKRLLSQKADDVRVFPGIKEALTELKKHFELGILTSNSTKNTLKILKNNEIEDCFSFLYTNSPAFGKWASIKKLIKKERLKKDEVIYVGDEIRDIDACNYAKIPIIVVTWGANSARTLKEEGANFYAYKPDDLVEIGKKLI